MVGNLCKLAIVFGIWPQAIAAAQTASRPSYSYSYAPTIQANTTAVPLSHVAIGPPMPPVLAPGDRPPREYHVAGGCMAESCINCGDFLQPSSRLQLISPQKFVGVRPATFTEAAECANCDSLGQCATCSQCQQNDFASCESNLNEPLIWRPERRCFIDGLGHERIMFAPFMIETTQPMNNLRLRLDLGYGLDYPDRSEFFWAKSNAPETSVSHQDYLFMFEMARERFSTQLHLPLRSLNPEINDNTTGFGDLLIANKLVLFNGNDFQFTGLLRTQVPTGLKKRGLGTGHVALEPGLLGRYRISPWRYLHGELRYIIPLGGDSAHAGQVLRYGAGMSYLLADSPTYAVMPTLEFIGHSFLSGQKSLPGSLDVTSANGDNLFMLYPGIRVAKDTSGDLGIIEYGMSLGIPCQANQFYDTFLRFDFRLNF